MDSPVLSLVESAKQYPDRPALRFGRRTLTYHDLDGASARIAAYLDACGVGPDDRVALMMPNVPEFAVLYYGILRIGAAVAPIDPLSGTPYVARCLSDLGCTGMFAWHTAAGRAVLGAHQAESSCVLIEPRGFAAAVRTYDAIDGIVPPDASQPAVITCEYGLGGRADAASVGSVSHADLFAQARVADQTLSGLHPEDVVYAGYPLFQQFGQAYAMNCAIAAGACVLLLPRFDTRAALDALIRHRATVVAGTPRVYATLMRNAPTGVGERTALRAGVFDGAELPERAQRAFERTFNCQVFSA